MRITKTGVQYLIKDTRTGNVFGSNRGYYKRLINATKQCNQLNIRLAYMGLLAYYEVVEVECREV